MGAIYFRYAFILLFLVFISDVSALLDIHSGKCFDDGSFILEVENEAQTVIQFGNLVVSVNSVSYGNQFVVSGNWSYKKVYDPVSYDYKIDKNAAVFNATIGSLNLSGIYKVTVSSSSEYNLGECPGFKYSCISSNLNIVKCYNYNNTLYVFSRGLNDRQYEKLQAESIVYYSIDSTKFYTTYPKVPKIQTKELAPDFYMGILPLEEGNNVKSVELRSDRCLVLAKEPVSASCRKLSKCETAEDCEFNEKCQNNNCVPMMCNEGEFLENHQCITACRSANICETAKFEKGRCVFESVTNCCKNDADCNDGLVCTEEYCSKNQCISKPVSCAASNDPCVIGTCQEPLGCQYKTDEKCDKGSTSVQQSLQQYIPRNILEIQDILEKSVIVTKSVKESEILVFTLFNQDHAIQINEINTDSIKITISSDPIVFIIPLLGKVIIDVNADNKGDLAVALKAIAGDRADLEFSKPLDSETISIPLIGNEPVKKSGFGILYVLGVLLIVTSGIAIYALRRKGKKSKDAISDDKEYSTTRDTTVIAVSNFSVKHGKNIILSDVQFEIKRGELVCLLGPSGTGKSSIIEALVGRKIPDKGLIKILNQDIRKNKEIRNHTGFVPQSPELYNNQSVQQNLLTSATKWGIKNAKDKAEAILSEIGLKNREEVIAKNLSGGQQKLLSLGMELIRDPDILILDEPTTGLDPNTRNNIITILSQIVAHKQRTVLFTTHFMDDAEECDAVIIIADKKIVAHGSPSKLKKMLPGMGKIVNIILENVTEDLLHKIKKIDDVKDIVREGRSLKIIINEPNAIKLGQRIEDLGGSVNKAEIASATMKEVFVYFTGELPKENE